MCIFNNKFYPQPQPFSQQNKNNNHEKNAKMKILEIVIDASSTWANSRDQEPEDRRSPPSECRVWTH